MMITISWSAHVACGYFDICLPFIAAAPCCSSYRFVPGSPWKPWGGTMSHPRASPASSAIIGCMFIEGFFASTSGVAIRQ